MNKSLLIILVFLMFVLVSLVSLIGFYIYNTLPNENKDIHLENKISEEELNQPLLSYEYKNGIFNITNSKLKEKILKLSFSLKISGKLEELTKIDSVKSEMDDAIISIVSETDSDFLIKTEGKNFFKDELIKQLNEIFLKEKIPFKINKILLTEIIIK